MSISISGNGTFTGVSTSYSFDQSVSIGGTLTYEDVTNIDSVGVVTARSGVYFGSPGSGTQVDGNSTGIGIGTDNPSAPLHILSSEDRGILIESTDANAYIVFKDTDTSSDFANRVGSISDGLYFNTGGGGERLRITSGGRVGLGSDGVSSPQSVLHVFSNSSTDTIKIQAPTSSGDYDAGFEVLRDTTAGGAKMVAKRNTVSGGVGWEWFTTANNTAEVNATYTSRMILTESGDLGIGTASPTADGLHIVNSTQPDIFMGTSTNTEGFKVVYNDTDTVIGNVTSTPLRFVIGNDEKARIDSSGRLLMGQITSYSTDAYIQSVRTSGQSKIYIESKSLADSQVVLFGAGARKSGGAFRYSELGLFKHSGITETCSYLRLQSTDGAANYFWTDDSDIFRISTNATNIGTTGGTVVGSQTSDERLKNVGGNVSYGLNEILQLQPKQYALKTEPDTNKLGFIAQEVESIIPEAVFDTGEELEGHQEGDRTKLGMEYVQLIPVLVNAIKEQQAMIETLEQRLSDAGIA